MYMRPLLHSRCCKGVKQTLTGRTLKENGLIRQPILPCQRYLCQPPASPVGFAALHTDRPTEYCVIVDANNEVVGAEPRDVTVRNRLLGRGSYVLVTNDEGELLVCKRSSNKDVYPGHWDVVVAGVVRAGEEYEDTAARELAEEIGVSEAAARAGLRRLFVFPYQDSSCHVWGCAFSYTHDGGRLQLQEEEVDWAGFRSREQVAQMLLQEQFTPVGRHILGLYEHRQNQGEGAAA